MADRDEDLRTYILADGNVAALSPSCAINNIPEDFGDPFIFIQERRVERDDISGQAAQVWLVEYAVECVSTDVDTAKDLQAAVAERLEGTTGELVGGGTAASWVSVEDQFDDYEPRMLEADEGLHVGALRVEVTL
jgi:hypothetical protein